MNRSEIREALSPLSAFSIETVPAAKITLTPDRLSLGSLAFDANPHVLGTLNAALPVPHDYFKRLPGALSIPLTRYALDEIGDAPVSGIVSPDGSLLAVSLGEIVPVRPSEVLDALDEIALDVDEFQVYERFPIAWRFFAITSKARAIRVGDVTKIGYEIAGSITGNRALTASLVSYRLICTNGAVHADRGGSFRRNTGGGDGLGDWLADAIAKLSGRGEHLFDDLEIAAATPVTEETISSLDTVFNALRFSQRLAVNRRIADEPPATVYDLLQHVSYVATHADCGRSQWGSFKRRRKMQLIAGALVGKLSTCESCHQLTTTLRSLDTEDDADDGTERGPFISATIDDVDVEAALEEIGAERRATGERIRRGLVVTGPSGNPVVMQAATPDGKRPRSTRATREQMLPDPTATGRVNAAVAEVREMLDSSANPGDDEIGAAVGLGAAEVREILDSPKAPRAARKRASEGAKASRPSIQSAPGEAPRRARRGESFEAMGAAGADGIRYWCDGCADAFVRTDPTPPKRCPAGHYPRR